nr:MAG: DUF3574 domain-containing protein [Leptolyngbya sp. IPPAS B-1204]
MLARCDRSNEKNVHPAKSSIVPTEISLTRNTIMEAPELIQVDLYFERTDPNSEIVSEVEFQKFVDRVVTPLFPDGLTLFDASGQSFNSSATFSPEETKVISLFVANTSESDAAINKIAEAYTQQFSGTEVRQVENWDDLKVGFGVGENLIDNDATPELIQVELFFGRNIAGVGEVSEEQFQAFVDQTITPKFPDGLTIFDANGQFLDSTDTLIQEPAKVVSLILEDTQTNETAIDSIVESYIQQFQQESVLQAVNESIAVSFGPEDDLIDNDSIPESIQVDLFLGRSIPGGGEVSQAEFQGFIDDVVSPLFSDLAVFDANGQFLDSTNTLIEEESKMVSLIFPDTKPNEANLNAVVESYIEQFQQESVLIVVDEAIASNEVSRDPLICPDYIVSGSSIGGLPTG